MNDKPLSKATDKELIDELAKRLRERDELAKYHAEVNSDGHLAVKIDGDGFDMTFYFEYPTEARFFDDAGPLARTRPCITH